MTFKEFAMKYTSSAINAITRLLPLKNQIIFESNPDFSDNTYFVYKKMIELGYNNKYKMVWILNGEKADYDLPENVYAIRRAYGNVKEKLKENWEISRSKYIIDCNLFVYKRTHRQKRIYLKHGLPLKNVPWYNLGIGEVDLIPVPSDYWIEKCAKEHNVDPEIIKPLGFPRNDLLVPAEHKIKNIIWMPTWISKNFKDEDHSTDSDLTLKMPFGLPTIEKAEDFSELNDIFKKHNAILYIRLHPIQNTDNLPIKGMSNIVLCDNDFLNKNNISLYEFLCSTDALVSDYSSIYYDYLKLNKPIVLVTKFYNEYKEISNSMAYSYEEYKELCPAIFAESFNELTEFFEDVLSGKDPDAERRKIVKEKYMPDTKSDSSENIINYMIENYNF